MAAAIVRFSFLVKIRIEFLPGQSGILLSPDQDVDTFLNNKGTNDHKYQPIHQQGIILLLHGLLLSWQKTDP